MQTLPMFKIPKKRMKIRYNPTKQQKQRKYDIDVENEVLLKKMTQIVNVSLSRLPNPSL